MGKVIERLEAGKRENQWKILLGSKFNHNIFNCTINHGRGKLQSEKRELKYFSIHSMMPECGSDGEEDGKRKLSGRPGWRKEKLHIHVTKVESKRSERPKRRFFSGGLCQVGKAVKRI